jgi:hypothetical protein
MSICRAITEEPEFCGEHNQFWPLCMKQKEAEVERLRGGASSHVGGLRG